MSNLTELKKIVTALGGTPSAGDTNDESLAKIAALLANMPSGGGATMLTLDEHGELDKTWTEVKEAQPPVILLSDTPYGFEYKFLSGVWVDDGVYGIAFADGSEMMTDSADGHPAIPPSEPPSDEAS